MAVQRRIKLGHADVFPSGAFVKGVVEPVMDFNGEKRPDGSRPQAFDKETQIPVWQVIVLDADDEAGKRETALTIRFVSATAPTMPVNDTPFPWTPVEFVGLTGLPYVDDNGNRPRLAWSFRADGMTTPGKARMNHGEKAA